MRLSVLSVVSLTWVAAAVSHNAHGQVQGGMVVAADTLASDEGERVLREGGNAIEAAIVTAAVLAVVEPYASGIGGGGFMLMHFAQTGVDLAIDSRVTAPQAATPDMFIGLEDTSGGLPVGVPGALKHWEEALRVSREQLNGRMTLADALAPAIRLARDGFPVGPTFIATLGRHADRLNLFPESARIFLDPGLQEGDIFIQSDLANTLQMIADQGIDAFYNGPIAATMVDVVQNPRVREGVSLPPGRMELSDVSSYQLRYRDVLAGTYRNLRVVTVGPPASGVSVIEMLNILQGFPIGTPTYGYLEANSLHVMLETMKLGYADKFAFVADPDFVAVPVCGLISPEYAATRRARISETSSLPVPVSRGNPSFCGERVMTGAEAIEKASEDESSTTHISVIDANGNMVSYTTTLSELFGSAMVVPGYGFLLNDTLRDFDLEGRAPNEARGGKRPKSGISPTFVFDEIGRPRLIAGAAGGNRIPAIVFSIISHVLDQNRPVDVAVGAPRIVNENRATGVGVSNTRYEPAPFTLPLSLINELRNRGQIITRNTLFFGASQCIGIDPDTGALSRGMDPRRGGEF